MTAGRLDKQALAAFEDGDNSGALALASLATSAHAYELVGVLSVAFGVTESHTEYAVRFDDDSPDGLSVWLAGSDRIRADLIVEKLLDRRERTGYPKSETPIEILTRTVHVTKWTATEEINS